MLKIINTLLEVTMETETLLFIQDASVGTEIFSSLQPNVSESF
jgi:hypothetical protein